MATRFPKSVVPTSPSPHRAPITSVDFSPDGRQYVSCGYDGYVSAWLRASSIPAWTVRAPDLLNQVRFDSTGRLIATGCADGFVYLLDLDSGAVVRTLGPHNDDVNTVAWSSDSKRIFVGCEDQDTSIHVWEWANLVHEDCLYGHKGAIVDAALSPCGRYLGTAGEDATARIWDLCEKSSHVLEHPDDPESLDWVPSCTSLVTGCNDGKLRMWRSFLDPCEIEVDLGAAVKSVTCTNDGLHALAGTYAGHLFLVRLRDGGVVNDYQSDYQWERSVAQNGDRIVVSSFGDRPVVYEDEDLGEIGSFATTKGINTFVNTDEFGVICAGDNGQVFAHDCDRIFFQASTILTSLAVNESAGLIAVGDYHGTLVLIDISTDDSRLLPIEKGPINSIVWLSDTELALGQYDGHVRNVDTNSVVERSCYPAHDGSIKSLAHVNELDFVLSASSDSTIKAWRGNELLYVCEDESMVLVNSISVAGDVGKFVSASRDGVVRIWSIRDGSLLETLPQIHKKSIKSVSVTPDCRLVATGSYDGYVGVARHSNGTWQHELLFHHGKPGVSAVSAGDSSVFSSGWDGSLVRWEFTDETDDPIKTVMFD